MGPLIRRDHCDVRLNSRKNRSQTFVFLFSVNLFIFVMLSVGTQVTAAAKDVQVFIQENVIICNIYNQS